MRLVVGLGNPGSEYAATRHNIGFRTVDRLREQAAGPPWRPVPAGKGEVCEASLGGAAVRLAKPRTYMNASGEFVGLLARYWKIEAGSILVVSDDFSLPLGRIRIRLSGSSGGQRGLESILAHLGTKDVPRLRLGIGPLPPGFDAADYVLGRFRLEEREPASEMIARAGDAVRAICAKGLAAAMNEFNPSEAG
ncbi:MAG: aminoacyl-tRNA hydrolase [Elusimicrobia bacterium]|nr:aminoacyl-tRNA hydrolase [Elusimicrobiota bacterium]